MAFTNTTVLSTREQPQGSKWVGQIVPVPTGRLDKVSLYLEPETDGSAVADAMLVVVEVYALSAGLPSGGPLASDSKALSDIPIRGFSNFRIQADVPTSVAVVLRVVGGDESNLVAWRYQPAAAAGQNLLISSDAGATWASDPTRKFSYVAYSLVQDAVDYNDQSAAIQAGRLASVVDDTGADFSLAKLDRMAVVGDTVAIAFGNFVVTLVIDQSGSMTWNDNKGLRFDFLKQYITDLESILPPGSTATYSLVKFRSRKVGRIDVIIQGAGSAGADVEGVRIVRNASHYPVNAADGVPAYEGLAENALDQNLMSGTKYFYSAFTFDSAGNFSEPRIDFAQPTSSITPPMGVAGFVASEVDVLSLGVDVGTRQAKLSWFNPQGFDYTTVTVVRRDDRPANSPDDFDGVHGFALLQDVPTAVTGLLDFPSSFNPSTGAINGHEYFYSIFTKNGNGVKCFSSNARRQSVDMSLVDRTWEQIQPPGNVPPPGFPTASPVQPQNVVVTTGDSKVRVDWVAGDAITRRFMVWHQPARPPVAMTSANGAQDFDGELVFEGTGTSFIHRGLDNGQPNFYVIVARDVVNNQSSPVFFTAKSVSGLASAIPPPPVLSFESDVNNSTSNELSWKLPIKQAGSITAFFGDAIRATANVTFADTEGGTASATLAFVEDSRQVSPFVQPSTVDPASAIVVAKAPSIDASAITTVVSMTPLLSQLNLLSGAQVSFHASLRVQKPDGTIIQEVITSNTNVSFVNPFDLSISNDPPQNVSRRTWHGSCGGGDSPHYEFESIPGVYVGSGQPFNATLVASFRGEALTSDIFLTIRILDANTNLPSSISLPGMVGGVLNTKTSSAPDEVLDRSGQPTGETVNKTSVDVSIPPQTIPGDYVLEVVGTFAGYTRTVTLPVHFEPVLNLDVDASAFIANGVDVAEQKAFVYFGPFDAPSDRKNPVPDLTVVDWTLSLIAGEVRGKARPFYSLDSVPGSGVKSYTRSGTAREVFFGPGADVQPPSSVASADCTDGELWQIQAKAKVGGQVVTGFAAVELTPPAGVSLDRIFMRSTGSGFNNDLIFADGVTTAEFEIIGKPELDGAPDDQQSGVFFRNSVVSIGGRVPSLEDGKIVTIFASPYKGSSVNQTNIIITTDLSPKGARRTAQATIINGRATFTVSLDAFVGDATGIEPPSPGEVTNVIYDSSLAGFAASPIVLTLTSYVVVEVDGKPVAFTGGTGDLAQGTPPVFLSFLEPLQG